jgi:hypothetical protein
MPKQRLIMTINKLFLAASLGLVLAACAGEQADTTAAEGTTAGEMPQAGDQGVVTGSPEENVLGDDTATTADASALGDPMTDPNAPATATDPMGDPAQTTDPALQGTETDTTTPPPSQ